MAEIMLKLRELDRKRSKKADEKAKDYFPTLQKARNRDEIHDEFSDRIEQIKSTLIKLS